MEDERIFKMIERTNDYIHGRLSNHEEVALWVEFLKDPYWFNMFETELSLRQLGKNTEIDH